ncbi:META domain-containing protein [Streptomyces sp. NPDC048172]|uniref:META domain-containing protein n=1 Tax=Streptomyces sp. NPDC048172 TaxID=3365505 RepID=UPI00371B4EBB
MKPTHAAPYALALLVLTACGTGTGTDTGEGRRSLAVTNVPWEARSVTVDGRTYPAPEGVEMELSAATARRGGGKIDGRGGCNRFWGTAALDKERMRVSGYTMTMEACLDDESTAFQKKFLGTLSGDNRLSVSADGRTLRLADGADRITFDKGSAQ